MAESKTLLSQNEIDALIFFLERHEDTQIGKVLDQNSIDKLVEIVRSYNSRGIVLQKNALLGMNGDNTAKVLTQNGVALEPANCELIVEIGEDQNVRIFCFETKQNGRYPLFPEAISTGSYVSKGSSWGKVVSPATLNKLSKLFDLKCSQETKEMVGKLFAKVVYGDENFDIPSYYVD